MADLNSCAFTGRLTRDAEVTTIGSKGTVLTKFAIAVNTGFGQYARTTFFNVQVWGKAGEAISQYLKRGKQVAVAGVLENQKYTGRDGQQYDSWTLTSQGVTLLADSRGASAEAPSVPVPPPTGEVVF